MVVAMCHFAVCFSVLTLLGALVTGAAHAQDDSLESLRGAADTSRDGNEPPALTRADLQVTPDRAQPGHRYEVAELSYRWWISRGRADWGLGLGTLAYVVRPTGTMANPSDDPGAALTTASGTVVTLGVRYRTSVHSTFFVDAAGVRGLGLDRDAVVGKVGIEFKAARSSWNVAYGGLGFRLAGDTRMTLRARRGGVALNMRREF